MDLEDMTSLTRSTQINPRRKPPILLLAVIWSLGIISWTSPQYEGNPDIFSSPIVGNFRLRRKFVFVLYLLWIFIMAFTSYFGAITYFICFFGLKEHFLRFLFVVICYWSSLMSGIVFCLPALITNNFRKSNLYYKEISWISSLHESTFLKRLSYIETCRMFPVPKPMIFIFFHCCGLLVSSGILTIYIKVNNYCLTWFSYVWITSELIGLTYFANFCYVLYLQRVILEEEYQQTGRFIATNTRNLEDCTEKVKEFFYNYYNLRKIFLLWLSIIIFSVTFGGAAYITWSYKKPEIAFNSTVPSTQYPIHPRGIQKACPYSCDDPKYLENQHLLFIYNVLGVVKLFVPVVLSFSVVRGLDIKYIWNRLILRFRLMSTTREVDFWNSLTKFTEKLHPKTTTDTKLKFIIPILGLAFGILGGWKNQAGE
ncbi:hypothetical protein HOLleu_40218 [Holothuria leucospilota]|uniref:Uncharacterized protein n=1 Tax=Holothuria leucospilota TaxID=206669 RepID=A0A9Q1BAD5_HOLLE|nr:hypothetical protein HOLleu_40218 [Holothuria leucospilota]